MLKRSGDELRAGGQRDEEGRGPGSGWHDPSIDTGGNAARRPLGAATGATPLVSSTMPDSPQPDQGQPSPLYTPKEIVAHLDRSVIGQDRAKRTLAVAVANHYTRLLDYLDRTSADPIITDPALRHVVIEKSNILLIGPSGSGKTLLARPWPSAWASRSPSPTPRR